MPTLLCLVWLLVILIAHHHTLFGGKDINDTENNRTGKDSRKFWTFSVTLIYDTLIQFLHKTPQLAIMYHPLKFNCKKISSSVDMVEIIIFSYMSTHSDLDLEKAMMIHRHIIVCVCVLLLLLCVCVHVLLMHTSTFLSHCPCYAKMYICGCRTDVNFLHIWWFIVRVLMCPCVPVFGLQFPSMYHIQFT